LKPDVIITTDRARRVALVRGDRAYDAVRILAPVDGWAPRWSRSGRGWLVPLGVADDLDALGRVRHWLVVRHERRAA
jgi:hypothetical protein